MEISALYKCLSDGSRLRILYLLRAGPLCGCHLVEALDLDQVKISKQLNYMKRLGILSARREANWMIYQWAEPVTPLLTEHLASLERHAPFALPFPEDERKLAAIKKRVAEGKSLCPQLVADAATIAACC